MNLIIDRKIGQPKNFKNYINNWLIYSKFQLVTTLLLSSMFFILIDGKAAVSAFLGGACVIVPSYIFAKNLFKDINQHIKNTQVSMVLKSNDSVNSTYRNANSKAADDTAPVGEAKKFLINFYAGEALKILLSIIMLVFILALCKIHHLAFMLGYIILLMSHLFTPLFFINKRYARWLR